MSRIRLMLGNFYRWLCPFSKNWITRSEAAEVAYRAATRKGLPWIEPIHVYRHYGDWAVYSFADHRGGNVRVIVDGASGKIKQMPDHPTPR